MLQQNVTVPPRGAASPALRSRPPRSDVYPDGCRASSIWWEFVEGSAFGVEALQIAETVDRPRAPGPIPVLVCMPVPGYLHQAIPPLERAVALSQEANIRGLFPHILARPTPWLARRTPSRAPAGLEQTRRQQSPLRRRVPGGGISPRRACGGGAGWPSVVSRTPAPPRTWPAGTGPVAPR